MKEKVISWPDQKKAGMRKKGEAIRLSGNIVPSSFLCDWAKGKKYFIKTYGCQANVRDSEILTAYFNLLNMELADNEASADIIIFNTCAIREHAETRIRGELGRLKPLSRQNPDLIIGLCGCMAHESEPLKDLVATNKHLNLVFGTHNIHEIYSLIENCVKEKARVFNVTSTVDTVVEEYPEARFDTYKAFVNIMYGCDKFCTYCIVPYTRGQQRSRKVECVVEEVKRLKEKGFMEVTLLGQNVNAYGLDFDNQEYDFAYLLEQVALTGIPRIRFTSPHPADFKENVFKVMAKYKNIMPALHLPMQSGSTNVLNKMNRRYSREEYINLVKMLRSYVSDVRLTTDIIVAFPTETEEDFLETLSIVKELHFASAYTFIYSPRVGTPASRMVDNLTPEIKQDRFNRLAKVVDEEATIDGKKCVNSIVEVLFDSIDDVIGFIKGYDEYNRLVHVKADPSLIGKIKKVKIIESHTYSYIGELIEK